jgi:beta-RFAP synthase
MFSFGREDRAQFGGIGVMIQNPEVRVSFAPGDEFCVTGDRAERVEQFVQRASRAWGLRSLPNCHIDVRSPADHTGLGVGTQLGLATAAGLRRFMELPELAIELLASSIGRAGRSAVGTYGFRLGGLIVDSGRETSPSDGDRLKERLAIPEAWRFVLVRPAGVSGIAGEREVEAFAKLPAVPDEVTTRLWRITDDEILPAVRSGNCSRFGEAVYEYGRLAGQCFSAAQGGPFASRAIADLVATIRDLGVAGVGQSSWGPTVFAVTKNEDEAAQLKRILGESMREYEISVSAPSNTGAVVNSRSEVGDNGSIASLERPNNFG